MVVSYAHHYHIFDNFFVSLVKQIKHFKVVIFGHFYTYDRQYGQSD